MTPFLLKPLVVFLPTKREQALKQTNVSPCIFFDTHSYLKDKYWQNLSRKQTVTLNCYVSRRVSCINQQLQKTLQDCRTVIRNPKNIESMKRSKKEHTTHDQWPQAKHLQTPAILSVCLAERWSQKLTSLEMIVFWQTPVPIDSKTY